MAGIAVHQAITVRDVNGASEIAHIPVTRATERPGYTDGMMILLLAAVALLFAHLLRSRAAREQRWHLAREQRRYEREQQWRAMIRDADPDRAG